MYENADLWVGRVNRLKQTRHLPEGTSVLFAYEKPQKMTDPQAEVFGFILRLMEAAEISHTEAKEEQNIQSFATA